MKGYRFLVNASRALRSTDVALVHDDEDVNEEVMRQVWSNIRTEIDITISGVTMCAAAWEDPEHWATDWADKLDIDSDEVADAVAALFEAAREDLVS